MAELIAEKVPICGSRDVDPDGRCHWQTNSRHIELVTYVLSSLEAEIYAQPARTHPPAAERWDRVAAVVTDEGHADTVSRLDRFWERFGVDGCWTESLPGPDIVLDELRALNDIDVAVLPEAVCGLLALADRHFAMSPEQHRAALAEDTDAETLRSAVWASAEAHLTAHPHSGLAWHDLFAAAEPEYAIVPHPSTISAARVAMDDRQSPRP